MGNNPSHNPNNPSRRKVVVILLLSRIRGLEVPKPCIMFLLVKGERLILMLMV
jgi:hypothetical protein